MFAASTDTSAMRGANAYINENSNSGSGLYNGSRDPTSGGNTTNNNNSSNSNSRRRSPRQGGRVSPNGRRSPNSYYDRTTTVHFVDPSTGRLMCTKLNRVQSTLCKTDDPGVFLCEKFLNGRCDLGSNCTNAHVPRQYLWNYLTPHVNRKHYTYEEGFSVRCYTPEMDTYYEIPCQYIFQTKGSDKYVELYNDSGDNFKEKFCLCPTILQTGYCEKGFDCEHVHSSVADLSHFKCIHTHVASAEAVVRYERLPAEIAVRVFHPNGEGDGEIYAGDDVLRTVGATQYEEAYRLARGTPSMKMQHCAHFQNKKMCRLGDGCRFLHVVSLALSTPMQEENPASSRASPRLSPVGEGSGSEGFQDANLAPQGATNKSVQKKDNAATLAIQQMLSTGGGKTAPSVPEASRAVGSSIQADQHSSPLPASKNEDQLNRRSPIRRNNPYGNEIA